MSDVLTTTESAQHIKVSRIYIQQAILRKKLKAIKRGRDWLIDKGDLEEFDRTRHHPGNPNFGKKIKKAKKKIKA